MKPATPSFSISCNLIFIRSLSTPSHSMVFSGWYHMTIMSISHDEHTTAYIYNYLPIFVHDDTVQMVREHLSVIRQSCDSHMIIITILIMWHSHDVKLPVIVLSSTWSRSQSSFREFKWQLYKSNLNIKFDWNRKLTYTGNNDCRLKEDDVLIIKLSDSCVQSAVHGL